MVSIPGPDVLRLLAIPIFLYVAVLDVRTRRIPSNVWLPLVALGVLALGWEGFRTYQIGGIEWTLWLVRVAISLGIVAPLGYLFWWLGTVGRADAKALITLAVLFPSFPRLSFGELTLPLVVSEPGVFSITVLANAVVLAMVYPIALAVLNISRGQWRLAMFVGMPIPWSATETRHGKLLEGIEGFTRYGVDLDALRMYLRWRDCDLAEIRNDPSTYRDPASLPATPHDPGDGRVVPDGGSIAAPDDPWGARAFVSETEGVYGTRTEELRAALTLLAEQEDVWISPGIPFLVPITLGLLVALVYGDVLTTLLATVGL